MIKFNNINLPSFVKVLDVKNPILPPISQNTMKIQGKAGLVDFGNEIDSKTIEVDFIISGKSPSDLKIKTRQLAEWLYYDEPKPLILPNEPSVYYNAKISGDTDLENIIKHGQGTLTFVCNNPYGYSLTEKTADLNFGNSLGNPLSVVYNGQLEGHPTMKFTFNAPTTSFNVVSANQIMSFGTDDVDRKTINVKPTVFNDDCSSPNGWTSATYLVGGTVEGNGFASNGSTLNANSNFGTGPAWHGPAGIKSLGTQVTNFSMQARVNVISNIKGRLGRVQIYGLDINNNVIFMIGMKQANQTKLGLQAELRVGNKAYMETHGASFGTWKEFRNGKLEVTRVGKKISVYVAVPNAKGVDTARLSKTFTINETGFPLNKLASIQVHLGANASFDTFTDATLNINSIKVSNRDTVITTEQVPVIFEAGDELIIDSSNDGIYLNGEPYYESLEPSSQFITLKKGVNNLAVSPFQIVRASQINFREVYW